MTPRASVYTGRRARRGGRVAEGTRLLSEYGDNTPSRVRIPPSPLRPPTICGRCNAPVAQLDRASVYGTEGQGFESLLARGSPVWWGHQETAAGGLPDRRRCLLHEASAVGDHAVRLAMIVPATAGAAAGSIQPGDAPPAAGGPAAGEPLGTVVVDGDDAVIATDVALIRVRPELRPASAATCAATRRSPCNRSRPKAPRRRRLSRTARSPTRRPRHARRNVPAVREPHASASVAGRRATSATPPSDAAPGGTDASVSAC